MLKIGDIREWNEQGGIVGVVASIDSGGYRIVTDTGNEVPIPFSVPSNSVRLSQDLRFSLDDLAYRLKRVAKLKQQIIDCQDALKKEEESIYYCRLDLNMESRKRG